jgi:hypothetical protein
MLLDEQRRTIISYYVYFSYIQGYRDEDQVQISIRCVYTQCLRKILYGSKGWKIRNGGDGHFRRFVLRGCDGKAGCNKYRRIPNDRDGLDRDENPEDESNN